MCAWCSPNTMAACTGTRPCSIWARTSTGRGWAARPDPRLSGAASRRWSSPSRWSSSCRKANGGRRSSTARRPRPRSTAISPRHLSGSIQREVTMVDLDLDVVRLRADQRVLIVDEDEFAEHQVRYSYPAEVITAGRTGGRLAVRGDQRGTRSRSARSTSAGWPRSPDKTGRRSELPTLPSAGPSASRPGYGRTS